MPAPSWRIKSWFSDLNEKQLSDLRIFFLELIKFNKVVNLVSAKSVQTADSTHFADSLFAAHFVSKKINKNIDLYDLGSGNGFPGLVYSIMNPDQKMVLMDSDERKCEFIKHVAELLELKNLKVQNKKIDLLPDNFIEQAICRGFAPIPKCLLMLRKIVKVGGVVFHMKSADWSLEISQIPTQLCSIWQPALEAEYTLPDGEIKMYLVRTDKLV
jgi:16S rRNA (guanine527-N7)-methyltransferase